MPDARLLAACSQVAAAAGGPFEGFTFLMTRVACAFFGYVIDKFLHHFFVANLSSI
jgi:hypothetical protein